MVTLNARKTAQGKNLSARDASSSGGGAYPMQVRVARQVHTLADNDIGVNMNKWPQVAVRVPVLTQRM